VTWLSINWRLLRCAPRLLAAIASGDDAELDRVKADIDALHKERDELRSAS
jgi:hypothetical protein